MSTLFDSMSDFRKKRHDFMLRYYDMSVKDLERHLGMGWQTIALVGGGIVALSLGHEGKLPIDVAAALALPILAWGLMNVFDANYWSQRAIAFLANVEAHYLTKDEADTINPYVGKHPRWKLLNSLKYQALTVSALYVVVVVYYVNWLVSTYAPSVGRLRPSDLVGALFPALIGSFFFVLVLWTAYKRSREYRGFVTDAPGPVMFTSGAAVREVLCGGEPASEGRVESGEERQQKALESSRRAERRWLIALVAGAVAGAVVWGWILVHVL